MLVQPVTRSRFAEMAGVTIGAITRAANSGLQAACIGSRIDVTHEAAQRYLETQRERRLKTPEFLQIWEFCQSQGMPDLAAMAQLWRLNEADAQRTMEDLISLGVPAPAHARGTDSARRKKIVVDVRRLDTRPS